VSPEQAAAREYIIGECVRLSIGEEAAFDRRAVRIAFLLEPSGATSARQLLDELTILTHRAYRCRRDIATGDFIVSRHDELPELPAQD
jgi:hypothetical protein